jgi:S1-C subfamily serine protease
MLGALTAGLAGASAGCTGLTERVFGTESTSTQFETRPPRASAAVDGDESVYAQVYAAAIDSVTLVDTDTGQGSGFVYDGEHVVTNNHVVAGADWIDVRFSGGRWRTATVVGADPYADLAVLAVADRPEYARPLALASEAPSIGQEVVVLGNPLGLGASLSRGVVSGANRSLSLQSGFVVPNAIQTDATINPGNSGGPLLTLQAEVLGVITARQGSGVGFGISAALTERVVPALLQRGRFEHTYVGIRYSELGPQLAAANGLDRTNGVLVVDVLDDAPADGVLEGSTTRTVDGIEVPVGGDVIIGIEGEPIHTQNDLSTYLALEASPGDTRSVSVLRDGRRQVVALPIGTRPTPGEFGGDDEESDDDEDR